MSCCWAEGIVLGRERRDFIPPHLFGESVSRDGDELVTRQTLRRDRRRSPVLTKCSLNGQKVTRLAARNTLASKQANADQCNKLQRSLRALKIELHIGFAQLMQQRQRWHQ